MKPVPIDELLFISKSGLPLFELSFVVNNENVDPTLLSGYLQAIKQFSETYIYSKKDFLQIDYGNKIITMLVGQKSNLAIISQIWDEMLLKVMSPILDRFEKEFIPKISPLENYLPETYAAQLKKIIIETLGKTYLLSSYTPIIVDYDSPILKESPLTPHINGLTNISQIIESTKLPVHAVYLELFYLWANNVISFNISISDYDVFLKTHNLVSDFKEGTSHYDFVKSNLPEIIPLIPIISSKLDGMHNIKEILSFFDSSLHEKIIDFLQYLLENHLIRKPTTAEYSLILSISIFKKMVEISLKHLKYKIFLEALNNGLKELNNNLISSTIILTSLENIEINFDLTNYLAFSDEQLMELADEWLQLIVSLLSNLPNKRKSQKIIEELVEYLNELLIKTKSEDLLVVEKLSLYLENLVTVIE